MPKKGKKGWIIAGFCVLTLALAGATAWNFQRVRNWTYDKLGNLIPDSSEVVSSEEPASSEASA